MTLSRLPLQSDDGGWVPAPRLRADIRIEVAEFRVHGLDKGELFPTDQVLDLFFPVDSSFGRVRDLEVDQFMHLISCRKRVRIIMLPMFGYSSDQVIGHAGIQDIISVAGEDVDIVFLHIKWR